MMKRFGFLSTAVATVATLGLSKSANANFEPERTEPRWNNNDRIAYAKYDLTCKLITSDGKKIVVPGGTFTDGTYMGTITTNKACTVIGSQFFITHKGYAIHQMQRKIDPVTLNNGDSLTMTWTINELYGGTWESV